MRNTYLKQNQKWYVYMLTDDSGIPFYIGKGCRSRCYNHIQPNSLVKINLKNSKIKSLGVENVRTEIVAYFTNECEAYDTEEWLISTYGLLSDGGILYQHAKDRNHYSDAFNQTIPSMASKTKTTELVEETVRSAYKMYYEDGESPHFISEVLGVRYATVREWMVGRKHKVLYSKYILGGLIDIKYKLRPDCKLHKGLSVIKLRELRELWCKGEHIAKLATQIDYPSDKLRLIFTGQSCFGIFKNYDDLPKYMQKRKNRSKWLEDKTYLVKSTTNLC